MDYDDYKVKYFELELNHYKMIFTSTAVITITILIFLTNIFISIKEFEPQHTILIFPLIVATITTSMMGLSLVSYGKIYSGYKRFLIKKRNALKRNFDK